MNSEDGIKIYNIVQEITELQKMVAKYKEENKYLNEENKQLKELYEKTCKHLFNIGNDELARYFKAQIDENNTFMVGDM